MLDPLTTFLVSTAFMLLTGAVLGFIHSALPTELQPAAADWRIGTLLVAGGSLLLASRGIRAVDWLPPVANGVGMFGLTLYWRALRRYFGQPDEFSIFAPMTICALLLLWFSLVMPRFDWRVLVASLSSMVIIIGVMTTLLRNRGLESTISSKVLAGVFAITASFFAVRGAYVFAHSTAQDTLLSPTNMVNSLTPLAIALPPTVGTTVFVLLLFERIRRDLHRAATTDALTGLANRRTITERAQARFAHARSHMQPLSVAVIDIDHFKQVNDRYGHEAGDRVLCAVAKALEAQVRGGQFVGRQGGEEFVAILEDATLDDAQIAGERLRAAVEHMASVLPAMSTPTTVSVGLSTMQANDSSFEALLRRADRALYEAKAAGRNCVKQTADEDSFSL